MSGTVLFPSPNWFHVSGLAVSKDGWLIYGGPSKSVCILQPLNPNNHGIGNENSYEAHVVNRAHSEKIISVDICREWPEKKFFLTGSVDGSVKQWCLEDVQNKIVVKSTHCLDTHRYEKEDVAGVGYSSESFAITVGTYGNVVKWDLNSNVAKTYTKFLKNFRPTCIACSHHIPLNVAVGTKQGVLFVLDLSGQGKIVYKVRGQDDEIANVSWCPQYEVLLRKSLKELGKKSSPMERLERIRSAVDEGHPNDSGVGKNLPDDSFDESIVQEDDTFDIYKDHEADEFGHKKFEPKDIVIQVKEEKEPDDFLTECLKLKEDILKFKNESEQSVDNLVEALDKTHVDSDAESSTLSPTINNNEPKESSTHVQKHLLVTIGKQGSVKIWSKAGKLVGSCVVPHNGMNKKAKGSSSTTVLWYKPNVLLIADGKSQLLQCNPLIIDCKNKLEWKVVHALHKRGLFCIATNAPRVQNATKLSNPSTNESSDLSPDKWKVWTIAQDRNVICYSMEKLKMVARYNTCGGFLYTVQSCPYDAKSLAISVGDGAVRVWETDTLEEDDTKLSLGHTNTYWQNVQGKVLTLAWHPTRENLLAFATGESRVGLIDASGRMERPAKTLVPSLRGAVYSLCWGDRYDLYAAGGGRLVKYSTDKPDQDPVQINVQLEGQEWELSSSSWYPRGLLCGSNSGAVAVLEPHTHDLITVAFIFSKMIHSIVWHPQQTSSSCEESPYKDLIAVSSVDKCFEVAILEYADKGDGPKLHKLKSLSGHKNVVLQVAWNPHKDAQLLSTSHDSTIRVWDVSEGVCIAIYGGHVQSSLGAAWSAFPQLPSTVMSGGADCCLRVWKVEDYPPEAYSEIKHEIAPKKDKKKKVKTENPKEEEQVDASTHTGQIATSIERKLKVSKLFLIPTIHKNMRTCDAHGFRRMAEKFNKSKSIGDSQEINSDKLDVMKSDIQLVTNSVSISEDMIKATESTDRLKKEDIETDTVEENDTDTDDIYLDFWKIFGNTNEFNEVLDLEMHRHLEQARLEPWIMLAIFRGHFDLMIQYATQMDALCPFLVCLSPCVSFKYWKDVTQLYLAQVERLVAKGEAHKIFESRWYGGSLYRRVALMLSVHDLRGAVNALVEGRLFVEAYILAKARHLDSFVQDVLHAWTADSLRTGRSEIAAMCYLALGDLYKAAMTLSLSNDQQHLSVAAELAKSIGQSTFATHIEDKKSLIISETPEADADEDLKELPSKIDLLKDTIQIDGGVCETKD